MQRAPPLGERTHMWFGLVVEEGGCELGAGATPQAIECSLATPMTSAFFPTRSNVELKLFSKGELRRQTAAPRYLS